MFAAVDATRNTISHSGRSSAIRDLVVMVSVDYLVIVVGPRTPDRQHAYSITPGRGFRNGPFASEVELRELVDMAQAR